jgi:hypothetical protein
MRIVRQRDDHQGTTVAIQQSTPQAASTAEGGQ